MAPGAHTIAGAPEAGYGPEDRTELQVVAVGLQRADRFPFGRGRRIRLTVHGTEDQLDLRVENRTPGILVLRGGSVLEVRTSGGRKNRAVFRGRATGVPGRWLGAVSLALSPCPCAGGREGGLPPERVRELEACLASAVAELQAWFEDRGRELARRGERGTLATTEVVALVDEIGVAVGMAPFLGLLDVPLFAPLLSLFPESVRATAIPLSSFLMGLVAVGIQFASGEDVSRRVLRWSFALAFLAIVVGLVVLLNLYTEAVLTVPNVEGADGRTIDVRLVVGGPRPDPPPPGCGCTPSQGEVSCIQEIGFENAPACWGRRQVARAGRSLTLAYLFLTGAFGALIGLLLLQEGTKRGRRQAR